MISRFVLQSCKGVHVDLDFVALTKFDDQGCAGHRVLVIVDMILDFKEDEQI